MHFQHALPFLDRERCFGQHIRKLLIGPDVFHLNSRVNLQALYEPVQINSMGPGNVPEIRTTALQAHFDHRFVVFEKEQL